jgi:hypothetical protein
MVRSAAQELIQEPATFAPVPSSKSYRLNRSDDLWFIDFEGERFGPYQTEREAMLFAIDAAHQFGDKGENTEVHLIDESGDEKTVWTYGVDPFPPNV